MPIIHLVSNTGESTIVELKKKTTIVGKREDNDIVLPAEAISRRHCEIFFDGASYRVRDLGSRNGTFVNNKRISSPVTLQPGTVINLGPYRLTFQDSGTTMDAEPEKAYTLLKAKIHEKLLEKMDIKHSDLQDDSDEELRQKTERTARKLVDEYAPEIPHGTGKEALVKDIIDEALGLGPLETLLADDEVDEIMVNSWDKIYVERRGKIEKTTRHFTNNQQVLSIIRRIISPIGRRVDESSPMVDARLTDGSRVNAIISPLALTGPTLTIRKFARTPYTVDDLISFGTLSPSMAEFLKLLVQYRANICISGGTGSGKTTLLNVTAAAIPQGERIVTIEDAAELRLPQEHVVSLESKPPNIAGEGAVRIRQLVINSLRMRPDRIVVGECRGGEALDMLQAMNTGHDGSLTTLHSNSPRDALSRLETMVLMAGTELPSRAIREQVTSAITFVVHLERLPDGTRKIVSIVEITGMEGETILTQEIFRFKQTGYDSDHKVMGEFEARGTIPKFIQEIRESGIEIDLGMFSPPRETRKARA